MLAFEFIRRGYKKPGDFMLLDAGLHRGASSVSTGIMNPLVFKRMTLSWGSELLPKAWDAYRELQAFLGGAVDGTVDGTVGGTVDGTVDGAIDDRPVRRILSSPNQLQCWKEGSTAAGYLGSPSPVRLSRNGATFHWAEIANSGWIDAAVLLKAFRNYLRARGQLIDGCHGDQPSSSALPLAAKYIFATGIQYRYSAPSGRGAAAENRLRFYPVKGDVLRLRLPQLQCDRLINSGVTIRPLGEDIFEVGSSYVRDFTDAAPDLDSSDNPTESVSEDKGATPDSADE